MIRAIKYLIYAAVAVCLVVIALANREIVTLHVLQPELAEMAGWSFAIDLPLFVVIFGAIGIGFLLGELFEWLREAKYRSAARNERRERQRLEQEVGRIRSSSTEGDEVLALVDAGARR